MSDNVIYFGSTPDSPSEENPPSSLDKLKELVEKIESGEIDEPEGYIISLYGQGNKPKEEYVSMSYAYGLSNFQIVYMLESLKTRILINGY
jgi:hypothetical protein